MLIKYLGPSPSVNVGNFGVHHKGEIKEYPIIIGFDLLEVAQKQKFTEILQGKEGPRDPPRKKESKVTGLKSVGKKK